MCNSQTNFSPIPAALSDICTSTRESGYELIDHNTPTNEMETENDLLDNIAYGQVESQSEINACKDQYEIVTDLKENTSYGSVSATWKELHCKESI